MVGMTKKAIPRNTLTRQTGDRIEGLERPYRMGCLCSGLVFGTIPWNSSLPRLGSLNREGGRIKAKRKKVLGGICFEARAYQIAPTSSGSAILDVYIS